MSLQAFPTLLFGVLDAELPVKKTQGDDDAVDRDKSDQNTCAGFTRPYPEQRSGNQRQNPRGNSSTARWPRAGGGSAGIALADHE